MKIGSFNVSWYYWTTTETTVVNPENRSTKVRNPQELTSLRICQSSDLCLALTMTRVVQWWKQRAESHKISTCSATVSICRPWRSEPCRPSGSRSLCHTVAKCLWKGHWCYLCRDMPHQYVLNCLHLIGCSQGIWYLIGWWEVRRTLWRSGGPPRGSQVQVWLCVRPSHTPVCTDIAYMWYRWQVVSEVT